MITRVQKWGNSLGVRIPKAFAKEVSLESGCSVDLSVRRGELVLKPVREDKLQLAELLARVSDDNLHGETPTGDPIGREAW